MKKRLLYFIMAFVFIANVVMAQTRTITGTVTDKADGGPIPGVSILVKGSSIGAQTNAEGKFTIAVPSGGTLVFKFVGYATKEITIGSSNTVNIALEQDLKELGEVVVTAMGIERDKRSLGYAAQAVKGDDLSQKAEPNVLNALQGKLSGVNISSSSGAPGAATNINIRGITSFTGSNQPLIVVDGIIFSNDADDTQNTLFGAPASSRLSDLSPESIESINVLKGPAASVLYGSRASAGVIVVTTKSGKGLSGKTEVTFNSSFNLQQVSSLPKLQNSFGQGTQNNYVPTSSNSWGPAFGTPGFENVVTTWGATVPYQAYKNNINDFYQTGQLIQNSLNIASGTADNNYAIALSSTLQDGIIKLSDFNRTSVQVGGNSKLKNGIKIGGTVTYVNTGQRNTTQGNGGSAFGQLSRIPRSYDLAGLPYTNELGRSIYYSTSQNNPFWSLENEFMDSRVDRAYGNVNIGYDFTSWLNVSYRITGDTYFDQKKQTLRNGSARSATGKIDEDNRFRSEFNGDLMINAKKADLFTSGLAANLMLGQNLNARSSKQQGVVAESLGIPGFDNVSNGSVFTNSYESNTKRRLIGYYGQLSLDYKSYLFLELSGRVDQSSTLPKDNNTYFYPSAAVSFVPTEAFKWQSDVLSYAKVRLNAAKVGRDADPYLLRSTYISASYGNNSSSITFPVAVGGSIQGFQIGSRIGAPNLKPEFVTSYEGGVNLGLFRNRIGLDVAYFSTTSTNQIFDVSISPSSGYDSRTMNTGKMTNKGWEIQLTGSPVKTESFKWDLAVNFTRIRNNVESIIEGLTSSDIPGNAFIGINPSIAVNFPYGVIIGSQNARNENGDLLINPNTGGFVPAISGQVISNPQADWTSGITNTFRYKNVSLSALVDMKKGGQLYSFTQADVRSGGAWEPTGVDRDQPRILPGVIANGDGTYRPNNIQVSAQTYWQGLGGLASEGAVFDASYYRLREVTLSYDLPAKWLKRTPFGQFSISATGRNLFLWAPGYPGDPETNTQGAGNIQGLDLNGMPAAKSYGLNLRVTF